MADWTLDLDTDDTLRGLLTFARGEIHNQRHRSRWPGKGGHQSSSLERLSLIPSGLQIQRLGLRQKTVASSLGRRSAFGMHKLWKRNA